jgi:hypothetical protein
MDTDVTHGLEDENIINHERLGQFIVNFNLSRLPYNRQFLRQSNFCGILRSTPDSRK